MFSANLNYRRLDLYRGLRGRSYGYPFRISSNYPITGRYPFLHKVEAVVMHRIITGVGRYEEDFSDLYPGSYIHFTRHFFTGLPSQEYVQRMFQSKIAWCPSGFATNETSRLLEACYSGCAVFCGELPDNEIYRGNPFIRVNDWRKIRRMTEALLSDEKRLDEVGIACRNWYESHFSPRAQAERIAREIQFRRKQCLL